MRIVNKPRHVELKDYGRALDEYIERAKKVKGVRTIATMGSVGAPGLSDIDIIVVTERKLDKKSLENLIVKGIDDNLFLHGPVVFPISMLPHIQWIIYASNLKVLYGADIIPLFDDLSNKEKRALSVCYLLDFIESRFLQISIQAESKELDCRRWMTRIWSVTHSVHLWTSVLQKKMNFDEKKWLAKVKHVRETWIHEKKVDEGDFTRAFRSAEELNKSLFMRCLKNYYKPLENFPNTMVSGSKKFIFCRDLAFPRYKARCLSLGHRSLMAYICEMPTEYFCHISGYLSKLGYDIEGFSLADDEITDVVKQRGEFVLDHWRWISEYAAQVGVMRGYLGVTPQLTGIGVKEKARLLAQRALLMM